MTATFTRQDVDALTRALSALQADLTTLERLGVYSPELARDVELVESLRDRMLAEHTQIRATLASRPFDIKEWVKENIMDARSVS